MERVKLIAVSPEEQFPKFIKKKTKSPKFNHVISAIFLKCRWVGVEK